MTTEPKDLEKRHELVFLYDVRDANPNGDPDDSNRPRMDAVTGENLVTDVRLKRTIRDYWISQGKEVFVRAVMDDKGNRKTMEDLALTFLGMKKVPKTKTNEARSKLATELPVKYLDVRAFGAAITLKNANYSHTGAVQFGLGRSLNLPEVKSFTITSSMASTSEKGQGTIGEYHVVDYSLLKFHGIVSAVSAKKIGFTVDDLKSVYQGMWIGTKELNTRSKFNHNPRLLVSVVYKSGEMQAGDLDLGFELKNREDINKVTDVVVQLDCFLDRVKEFQSKIESINILHDGKLKFAGKKDEHETLGDALKSAQISIPVKQIEL